MRPSLLLVLPLALLAAACGSSSSSSSAASSPSSGSTTTAATTTGTTTSASAAVSTRALGGLGTVLVDGRGRTLYVFTREKGGRIACTGACASVWPPLTVPAGSKPALSGAVKASLVSSVANPSGGRIVTYAGWPLRTYASDTGPGSAKGQDLKLNGGIWYVIAPSGKPVTVPASSSSTTNGYASGGGSGYGGGGSGYGSGGSGYGSGGSGY
jgi:predicted lipoprotein with Yx(FWY)xxD motif